ncbi:MAG: hypothetical protein IKI95_07115 [Clostridia bacterium]|nr:hypothetical protein [Clostridia bacterium]
MKKDNKNLQNEKEKMFPEEMKVFIQKDGKMFPLPLTMGQLRNYLNFLEEKEENLIKDK